MRLYRLGGGVTGLKGGGALVVEVYWRCGGPGEGGFKKVKKGFGQCLGNVWARFGHFTCGKGVEGEGSVDPCALEDCLHDVMVRT